MQAWRGAGASIFLVGAGRDGVVSSRSHSCALAIQTMFAVGDRSRAALTDGIA